MMQLGSIDRADPAVLLKLEQIAREMQQELGGKGYVGVTLMPDGSIHCIHEVGSADDDVQFVNLDIWSPGKQAVVSQC